MHHLNGAGVVIPNSNVGGRTLKQRKETLSQ
jgi:hypothetical protein